MPRLVALKWAEHQAGRWYCWGGTGPTCYDCSGLVAAAYQHAGISLPDNTYAMLDDPRLKPIPARDRRPGDLAFYGTGHVELVTSSGTFGALDTGSQVGWHQPNDWWYPTMYYAVRLPPILSGLLRGQGPLTAGEDGVGESLHRRAVGGSGAGEEHQVDRA
jgi:hypothetical protein